jgi:hypothetical protein
MRTLFLAMCIATTFSFLTTVQARLLFTDVPADHWASSAIDWVSAQGIMTGPKGPEALFLPNETVSRAQMAVVLTRLDALYTRKIEALELRIAELEHAGFLVEELLNTSR